MKNILDRLESLTPEKRTLLVQLIKKQGKQFNVFPVSFAQQRMWVLDQLLEASSAYTISGGVRLSGPLQKDALQQALDTIVARHEALRTVFIELGGQPVQVIQPATPLTLPVHELSHLPAQAQEQEVQRLLTEESGRPFDLARGPLFRPVLLRLSDTEHVLLVNVHHIVFDGWSLGILIGELVQLYEAFVHSRPSPLPELPLQYADFAQWQRTWLEGTEIQDHLAYWREQLAGPLPTLQLPTDRPRPARQRFAGSQVPFEVSAAVTQRLQVLSQQEGATLFMTLLAAFKVLLFRYSGQSDLLVGTPVANRTRAELEGLIGCFINTLVLRSDLSGNPTFREVLRRVKKTALEAYAHQDLPFELLVEKIQPQRDLSRNPLFQVMFVLQNAPLPPLRLTDLTIENLSPEVQAAKLDLTLLLWETPGGLRGSIEYDRDLFDESTLASFAGHLRILLEGIVETPDERIGELALLSTGERETILTAWNTPIISSEEEDRCLHQIFEEQAQRREKAPAVSFEDRQLTYGELNNQAELLACALKSIGVGPEDLVGVFLERSLELPIGLLGTLKAGAGYVPIDPGYPSDRIDFMLQDARVRAVVSQRSLQAFLPATTAPVLWLDELLARDENQPSTLHSPERTRPSLCPDNIAYVIYTSGSTGQPKGVMVSHRQVARLFASTRPWFQFNERDVWTLFHSFAFDFSVWELWGALLYGGRLVIVPYLTSRSPEAFYELLQKERVTILNQTPSAFYQLQQVAVAPTQEKLAALRTIIFGGEALEPQRLIPWIERYGDARPQLVNMYGITETTVHVTYRPLTRADTVQAGKSPVGRQIPDLQIYLLDQHQQLAPVGASAEIYVGGAGLARGYLNRPELTAERFVPHPFSPSPGERLYKTGDLARYRADGTVEYLGRIDHQVKIRGFRIELGEIEQVLSRHPQVQEVAVLVRADVSGEKQLVAYVVARQAGITTGELRSFLRERVPSYMVPAAFVWLEALPLTPHGKLDRRALPAPEKSRGENQYVPPRTALEEQIARIWARALGLERVGIQDNFFDIGGHSLLAVQILADMREQLHRRLSLGSFFTAQTVAEVARLLEDSEHSEPLCLVPIKTTGRRPALYCFHPAGGEVLMYRELANCLDEDQPVYGVQSRALEGTSPEHPSIEAMAQAYAQAICRQQPEGPYYLLGWSMGGVLALAVASELERAGRKVALVGLLDAYLTSPELVQAQKADALEGLGVIIEVALMQTFVTLSLEEQIRLREGLLALPPEERLQQALTWGKERRILPESLSLEALRWQEALVNTHIDLVNAYQAPVIETPLVTWLAREAGYVPQERTNWQLYTKGGVQELMADGNHFTMIRPPYIQQVAQQLKDILRSLSEGEDHARIK